MRTAFLDASPPYRRESDLPERAPLYVARYFLTYLYCGFPSRSTYEYKMTACSITGHARVPIGNSLGFDLGVMPSPVPPVISTEEYSVALEEAADVVPRSLPVDRPRRRIGRPDHA
jgi:hypothetical protein